MSSHRQSCAEHMSAVCLRAVRSADLLARRAEKQVYAARFSRTSVSAATASSWFQDGGWKAASGRLGGGRAGAATAAHRCSQWVMTHTVTVWRGTLDLENVQPSNGFRFENMRRVEPQITAAPVMNQKSILYCYICSHSDQLILPPLLRS